MPKIEVNDEQILGCLDQLSLAASGSRSPS
jgi:hypothetical protein